jgi:hypothetical protein
MIDFTRTLNSVLVESEPSSGLDLVAAAKTITTGLEAAKVRVRELENQLNLVHSRISGELAITVRKLLPSLNVGVTKDSCKVGYKSKHLQFVPDLMRGVWVVKSSDHRFANAFLRHYAPQTVVSSGLAPLSQAIIAYFVNHYRSLGEDITGTGLIVVEDRRCQLSDLVAWRNAHYKLNSRSAQRVVHE